MSKQGTLSSNNDYTKGFIASLVLTIIPFYFTWSGGLPHSTLYPIMFSCAIVQVVVHFVYFLHMEVKTDKGQWNFVALVFTSIVVSVLIGGSLWIMYNLNLNMMM